MKQYLTSVFLLWGENKKQRNQTESRKRVRELLQHRPQISSALSFSLDASELIWSCGRWKLLQPQKCNTTVDVWTPDACFFHLALALAPFTLCFTARLMFLKHFIKRLLKLINETQMFCCHFFSWDNIIHDYHTEKTTRVAAFIWTLYIVGDIEAWALVDRGSSWSLLINTWVYHWAHLYRGVSSVTAPPVDEPCAPDLLMGNHLRMSPDFLLVSVCQNIWIINDSDQKCSSN